jgi:hypothetical protein
VVSWLTVKPPAARSYADGLFSRPAVMRLYWCAPTAVKSPTAVGKSADRASRVTCPCASAISRATLMFGLRSIAIRSASASVSLGPEDAAGPAGACAAGSCREGIGATGACACCERTAQGNKTSNNKAHAAGINLLFTDSVMSIPPRPRSWLGPVHGSPDRPLERGTW